MQRVAAHHHSAFSIFGSTVNNRYVIAARVKVSFVNVRLSASLDLDRFWKMKKFHLKIQQILQNSSILNRASTCCQFQWLIAPALSRYLDNDYRFVQKVKPAKL